MAIILISDEASHAMKYGGPNLKQLVKMLNSNQEKDMPSSRHVRWMAAFILTANGHVLNKAPKK